MTPPRKRAPHGKPPVCWDPGGTDQFAVKRLAEVRAI
jgi:hypothetical protein